MLLPTTSCPMLLASISPKEACLLLGAFPLLFRGILALRTLANHQAHVSLGTVVAGTHMASWS